MYTLPDLLLDIFMLFIIPITVLIMLLILLGTMEIMFRLFPRISLGINIMISCALLAVIMFLILVLGLSILHTVSPDDYAYVMSNLESIFRR